MRKRRFRVRLTQAEMEGLTGACSCCVAADEMAGFRSGQAKLHKALVYHGLLVPEPAPVREPLPTTRVPGVPDIAHEQAASAPSDETWLRPLREMGGYNHDG